MEYSEIGGSNIKNSKSVIYILSPLNSLGFVLGKIQSKLIQDFTRKKNSMEDSIILYFILYLLVK